MGWKFIPTETKSETFQFKAFNFPEGGKKIKLGSPANEANRGEDEAQYEVTLTKSFEMQVTPVTQLQWSLVMGENPSYFKKGGKTLKINGREVEMNPNPPVEMVSWDDAQKYIQKLNETDPKYNYRLPTEAEWEYAVSAGTDTRYSFGSDPKELGGYAWYEANSGGRTHDVASLKPNPNGLYDMHGNVWEWVQDWYGVSRPNAIDPTGPKSGSLRVLRGGGWRNEPHLLRSAQRHFGMMYYHDNAFGFRLVRTPK